jgi:uncharacterized protein
MRKFAGIVASVLLFLLLAACTDGPCVTIVSPEGKTLASVSVEVADTNQKRELGLMYRAHLDDNAGMIFVFPHPDQLVFWMKNTKIPLDMIFADPSGHVLGTIVNAVPYSEKNVGVRGLSQYVLEVNGGFAARHSIVPGDRMEFTGFDPHTLQ